MSVDKAPVRLNGEVKLIGSRREQHQVAAAHLFVWDAPKLGVEAACELRQMISSEAVVAPDCLGLNAKGLNDNTNTIQTAFAATLREKGHADERSRSRGIIDLHQGSGSGVAGQQIVAGQVRFAAEIRGIVEP